MTLEREIPSLLDWLLPTTGGIGFLLAVLVGLPALAAIAILICYVITAARHGPVEAFYIVAKTIFHAVTKDLPDFSLRRTSAIAWLAVQESIRRWVLVAFVVFLVVLLFASWFLDVESDHPARLYISFVLNQTNLLIILLALFLSTFSLPTDIKNRTIYTVVTKPVRSGEIVLGRILGFSAIGTALVVAMCGVSYLFVVRGLDHDHFIDPADLATPVSQTGDENPSRNGVTSYDAYHRHQVTIDAEGIGATDLVKGHFHEVREEEPGRFVVGPPQGELRARVPTYGKLRFYDRSGSPGQGINVGKEWTYRQYIEGGTLAAAVWTFEGVTEDRYPDGLPIEMTLSVFRTYKGNIERGIPGTIELRHPNQNEAKVAPPGAGPVPAGQAIASSAPISFTAEEFSTDEILIRRDQVKTEDVDGQLRDVDLFNNLVDDQGRIEVWVKCSDPGQYFGMAQADLYLRASDNSFAMNFVKGYISIWLQMIMVVSLGVVFSTFLSGAVALVATLGSIVLGYFSQFITDVATGANYGGGPIESLIRILTQKNVMVDLDIPVIAERIVWGIDYVLMAVMRIVAYLMPNFREFSTSNFVAYGFDISSDLMTQHLLITFTYVFVLTVAGYFLLRTREIAA